MEVLTPYEKWMRAEEARAAGEAVPQFANQASTHNPLYSNSKDLAKATSIRNEEASVFAKNEAELEDAVSTLGRAMSELDKGAAAGSAASSSAAAAGKSRSWTATPNERRLGRARASCSSPF